MKDQTIIFSTIHPVLSHSRWLKIEQELHQLEGGKLNYIRKDGPEITGIMEKYDLSAEELAAMLFYHTQLGEFIHFPIPGLDQVRI